MTKFELIEPISLTDKKTVLRSHNLPEIVHLDDPALAVMKDFNQVRPESVSPSLTMNDALNEMKIHGVHILLAKNEEDAIIGLISTEDILGEKPIRILQERRIERSKITVKMLMTPIDKIVAFKIKSARYAKVGNVVETLKNLNAHYALVIDDENSEEHNCLCGMFSTWQIGRQLHTDIADSISNAQSVLELQKRKKK